MITKPTCLILGAGASMPYGFPSGEQLKWRIVDEVAKPNTDANRALRALGHSQTHLKEFVDAFAGSKQGSIDAFLANNQSHGLIGKRAIAAILVGCEVPERLLRPSGEDPDDWISLVWASLQDGGRQGFPENQLSIVSFNYDRTVERALRDAYKNTFGVGMIEEATEAVSAHIPIVKVHGSLGELVDRASDHGRLYRPTTEPHLVEAAADGLKVLHEGTVDSPEFTEARRLIEAAGHVVLLGCAYHRPNMERLNLRTGQPGARIGSGYGLTPFEARVVKSRFGVAVGDSGWRSVRFLRESVLLE